MYSKIKIGLILELSKKSLTILSSYPSTSIYKRSISVKSYFFIKFLKVNVSTLIFSIWDFFTL